MNELDTRVREALDLWRLSDEPHDWQDVLIRAEALRQRAAKPSRRLVRARRRLILVVLVATLAIVLVAPASGWMSSAVRDLFFSNTSTEESHGPAPEQVQAQSPVSIYDPYQASLAFAQCMREQGIPHPNPDRSGNFELTPRDEARMKRVPRAKREAADKACFRYLKPVVSTKPLSPKAKARTELTKLSRCMADYGYVMTGPIVRDLSRGRLFFGFKTVDPPTIRAQGTARYKNAQRTCERGLAKRLDKIVAADRGEVGH